MASSRAPVLSLGLVACEYGRHCLEYAVVPDQLMKENR